MTIKRLKNFKKALRHCGVLLLTVSLIVSSQTQVQAFESVDAPLFAGNGLLDPLYNSRNDHGRITMESLTSVGYSPSCAAAVADANVGVDLAETRLAPKLSQLIIGVFADPLMA